MVAAAVGLEPHLLMIHLLKLHPSTNLNQVSLHLRHAFLIIQPCASFHQDPGLSTVISFVMCHSRVLPWLNHFMPGNYVLPSLRCHDKPLPVDSLCNMWTDNDLGSFWNLAKGRANQPHPPEHPFHSPKR